MQEYTLQPWQLKGKNIVNAQIMMSASLRGLLSPQASPLKKKTEKVDIIMKMIIMTFKELYINIVSGLWFTNG